MAKVACIVLLCGLACSWASPAISPRIVGGSEAAFGKFPYVASIRLKSAQDVYICVGSIINENTILTSAQCITGENVRELGVVVGTHSLIGGGQGIEVEKEIIHEDYDAVNNVHDIALLKLAKPIQFNKFTQPIEISETPAAAGDKVVVSGWGWTSVPGGIVNNLQSLNAEVLDFDKCKEAYKELVPDFHESKVCTVGVEGRGACVGDQGGALVNREGKQVAIVSFGVICAKGYPDVYTDLSIYRDWIAKNAS